jgi:hypothetical protein
MAHGLVESELTAFDRERSVLGTNAAESAAIGTGLLGSEGLGLLVQERAKGALGQARGGGGRNLLHGLEVEGTVGIWLSAEASGDDFSPAGGEVMDVLEQLRR